MEPDRYQKNHKYYILGMISLIASFCFIALTAYILPYLIFGWRYHIPSFVVYWVQYIQTTYYTSLAEASWMVCLFFILISLISYILAHHFSSSIEAQIHPKKKPVIKKGPPENEYNALGLFLKISAIILLVFIAAQLLQWAVSSNPTP